MDVKPIRTEADYDAALARIDALWDAQPGTEEYDLLDVLSILVEAYEEEHYPIEAPDPVEAIEFRMEQLGLSRRQLEEILGVGRGRVSEILNRRRPLSLRMIRTLHARLQIPAEILIGEPVLGTDRRGEKRRHEERDEMTFRVPVGAVG